ncbi:MAG: insulinase family protein [Chitinophagaceae bacterium]|nr:insulinase family protein [Chitinophagaceae bacterium]
MIDRTISPKIKDAVEFDLKLKPYEKYKLNNGVEVFAVNAGVEEVLQVELVFAAGNNFEKLKGVAGATNSLLKNGTSAKTAFQINEYFEYFGAHCNRGCYNETAVVSISGLNKYVGSLLPVVKEMITDSVFSDEEFNIYKQNTKQRLSVSLQKSDFVASRLIDAYLYGENHPYGTYLNAEDLDAITTADLKKYFSALYVNGSCVIFVSGKIPANLKEQLNENFGTLPLKPYVYQLPLINKLPAAEKKYRKQIDVNGVQGSIRIAREFPNRHHPDFMKVMVLNTLFGGYFGSRLMSNIREDKGYTYGIHSYIQNHIGPTAWMISTDAGKDVCEATIEEVYKEMQRLREELVDAEELMLVRNYLIGTILGDLDGPFQIMGRWKNLLLNNLDENYFYNSVQTIKTITAEELRELAKKYLNPQNFYELVVV